MSAKDFESKYSTTWCPGCGNFGILNALKKACEILDLDLEQTVQISGIGCSSKIVQYVNMYRIETIHGRALPVATGIKLANHKLTVIVDGGDGDGMGIGMGHFVHTARRNPDINYFIHNNQIYALTKGQASPTTEFGAVTKFTPAPLGSVEMPINIVHMALAAGASFVAREYAGDIDHLAETMVAAVQHKGFAVIDILQPCFTFNKLNTYNWYRKRVYRLDTISGYDSSMMENALQVGSEWGEKIPLGTFYRQERMTLEESIPQLKEQTLVAMPVNGVDITSLMNELT